MTNAMPAHTSNVGISLLQILQFVVISIRYCFDTSSILSCDRLPTQVEGGRKLRIRPWHPWYDLTWGVAIWQKACNSASLRFESVDGKGFVVSPPGVRNVVRTASYHSPRTDIPEIHDERCM